MFDYNSDKIIKSNEAHRTCGKYKLKSEHEKFNKPNNLDFKIGYKSVTFEEK